DLEATGPGTTNQNACSHGPVSNPEVWVGQTRGATVGAVVFTHCTVRAHSPTTAAVEDRCCAGGSGDEGAPPALPKGRQAGLAPKWGRRPGRRSSGRDRSCRSCPGPTSTIQPSGS